MSTSRALVASAAVGLGLAVLVGLLLRVPGSHWDRGEALVDDVPVEDFGFPLGAAVDSESGARWRLVFGEDATFMRSFDLDPETDLEQQCERLDVVASEFVETEYRYSPPSDGPFRICSVSYRVFDLPDDYIEVFWSLRETRDGTFLRLAGVRPYIQS